MSLQNKRVAARGSPTERQQAARLASRCRRVGEQRRPLDPELEVEGQDLSLVW